MNFARTSIIELAAIVAKHLRQHDIEVVLVGGLAVEIYSENLYLTKDIDMVNTNYKKPEDVHLAMAELGFYKDGRVYVNKTTDITIEFPPGPLSVGDELIKHTEVVEVGNSSIPILGIKDVVKDRLAAYFHWRDNQSLIQAMALLIKHKIELNEFEEFCSREFNQDVFARIETFYQQADKRNIQNMLELEELLTQVLIESL